MYISPAANVFSVWQIVSDLLGKVFFLLFFPLCLSLFSISLTVPSTQPPKYTHNTGTHTHPKSNKI